MRINSVKVTGNYGFKYNLNNKNILLGKNGTGKSTFMKLIMYGLGAKITNFIDEIAKFDFTDYLILNITTKSNNQYQIIRKLPYVDHVTIIPIKDGALINDEVQILNLSEYSSFLLEEEHYEQSQITYSGTKTATLTYRFLLRTALVDQFTPHNKILASISGDKNEFMNNQELLNTAIIEEILDTLNQELQTLKLELKQSMSEKKEILSKIAFYHEVRNEFLLNETDTMKKIDKINEELLKLTTEKNEIVEFQYKHLENTENVNSKESQSHINNLRKKSNELRLQKALIQFEITDITNMLKKLQEELLKVRSELSAHKTIINVPITICPICLHELDEETNKCFCKHCDDGNTQDVLESVANYKKSIEDTIKELNILLASRKTEGKELEKELKQCNKELSKAEKQYFDKLNEQKASINNALSEIKHRLEVLTEKELKLNESKQTIIKLNKLNSQKEKLSLKITEINEDIKVAEKKSADDQLKFIKFEEMYTQIFNKIYGTTHDISISREDYMPIIDKTSITNSNHSESIKVVAHLSYILTLYILNKSLKDNKINNIGFVMFDSPKDKDLDIDKYERFLSFLSDENDGQLILSGSLKEEAIYHKYFNDDDFIDFLTDERKLLKKLKS